MSAKGRERERGIKKEESAWGELDCPLGGSL